MEYEFGRIVAARAGGFENLILGAGSNGQGFLLPAAAGWGEPSRSDVL